jgi:16S rRNA (cytidine1402-2'-O)-methyltransferase
MVGTLYVVGVPAGDPEHLTLRARRLLKEAGYVVAEEVEGVQALLAHHGITVHLAGPGTDEALLELLEDGVVALAVHGWPGEVGGHLVSVAAESGHKVVAVPGPALPITALILSGLPADAFYYLGELPRGAEVRRRWVSSMTGEERTLVALASSPLSDVLSDLHQQLGDRPLAIVPASVGESGAVWRGRLAEAVGQEVAWSQAERYALVLGGAEKEDERWEEQRLAAEIEVRLARGERAKEISRHLAEDSGWSRRQIYDRVVALRRGSE